MLGWNEKLVFPWAQTKIRRCPVLSVQFLLGLLIGCFSAPFASATILYLSHAGSLDQILGGVEIENE